jgi:hypothetical protein
MRFLDGSSNDRSSHNQTDSGDITPEEGPYGGWARAIARLLHMVEFETQPPTPVRVFYKFDSGRWRHRSTRQLHKVYRCK